VQVDNALRLEGHDGAFMRLIQNELK